jgi:hypothetical protein
MQRWQPVKVGARKNDAFRNVRVIEGGDGVRGENCGRMVGTQAFSDPPTESD